MRVKKHTSSANPRLFNIIDDLKDGFCTSGYDGELIYLNIVAKELLAYKDNDYKNFFVDVIREKSIIEEIKNSLDEYDYLKDFEVELFSGNDSKFPALISITKIKNPSDRYIGMSILIKDMTYIKEVQKQLLQAQKMESIGMLASGIAHEFNNILTAIIPNAELMKITIPLNNANYNRADTIHKSAIRASEIVKKLLNFARDDNSIESNSTDVVKIIKDTIDILKRLFDRKIKLRFSYEDNLLNAAVDDTSIQQIIMNLSINAKDAIEESGEITFIVQNVFIERFNTEKSLSLRAGPYVKLQVSDNGHGIEKERIEFIFDPFYTTKAPGKGTGLGLSMVYGIVKAFNGSIKVESEIGVGTTFTIYIPATQEKVKKTISDFQKQNIGNNRTVLVIDDERFIAEMATDMLNSMGFKVISANTANEGVSIYKKNVGNISVVILDLIMPQIDGISCFKYLKEIDPDVKVIISSGISETNKIKELYKMGISGYLEKPYSMKKIAQTLESILS